MVHRHSSYRRCLGGERAGQGPLQGFHPTPILFLCCLRNSNLHYSNVPLYAAPIDVAPLLRYAGRRRFILADQCFHAAVLILRIFPNIERQHAPCGTSCPTREEKLNKRVQSVVLRRVDQLEVCPLSRGMMFQSLSGSLQPGIRFFQPPIPAQPTAFLAVRLPEQNCTRAAIRAYHVPHALHDWVRACLFAGGLTTTYSDHSAEYPATYLLVSACHQLWHRNTHDVYQQFTCVAHTSQPSSSTDAASVCCLRTSRSIGTLTGATLSGKLHTPPLPVTHVPLGYR
ncbi:conserved protein of unknown function [Cupriavidus taiwanensis]|uniref:Uncharacterized protein n=1 Tax=Cupriavidus taiwanensis TaxID=164546 RepID=A0A7Z7J569_9BURK|nr:protein of unknown function [Cupriavidus taiwanensis]SPC08478.1 hypothetical protein CBM2594_A30064 [Cupriavidus taiwanensis]SPD38392.1 conserved protein of unknown function [Cupriavidus taiwanensis]